MKFMYVLLAATVLSAPAVRAADATTAACVAHAAASLDALTHGNYAGARKDFDDAVASKLDAARLAQVWEQLQGMRGAYRSHGALQRKVLADWPVVATTVDFASGQLGFVAACDAQDRIATYEFVPAHLLASAVVRAHVEADGVRVSALDVPTPVGPLRGALTLPAGSGPFPAVVLVAGSGPQDMDETIGPNKPFRDIAEGLARAGIATLRYDKRTFDHPGGSGIVIDAEVTDDAVAAAHLLALQKVVDPKRVFVLGHSLGAMMAPRIGRRDPQLAGLVLMAAPARNIFDVLEQQVREQMARKGASSAVIARAEQVYAKERQSLALVGAGKPIPEGDFVGAPQGYWLSWSRVDAVADAKATTQPMLVLQGAGDFQVSPTLDFARWQRELAGRPHTAFRLYPGLSHLFMPAGKTGTLADYKAPAHVDAQVIGDIAAWVKAQSPR